MVTITFITPDGSRRDLSAPIGHSVMEVARDAGLPGIIAECNGSLSCATCHCYVSNGAEYDTGSPSTDEDDMLDFTAAERRSSSRLSCQIRITAEMEGLEITLPERQN